jgi:vacuolar-type H+-ATPase subunit I/STV1
VQVATLERTLDQMIQSNAAMSKAHKPVNEKRAFAERSALRQRLDKVYDRLKFKRADERNVAGDVQQAEGRLVQLEEERDSLLRVRAEIERLRNEAQAALQVRVLTLQRACTCSHARG